MIIKLIFDRLKHLLIHKTRSTLDGDKFVVICELICCLKDVNISYLRIEDLRQRD